LDNQLVELNRSAVTATLRVCASPLFYSLVATSP
jgi:hypothetical protein